MLQTILFYVFSAVLIVAAFRVVTVRNPVAAALHLILTFFTAAMIWMLLEAEFLSLLLILVYVGAVMVLFLFVVMMFDFSDALLLRKHFRAYMPIGLVIGLIIIIEIGFVFYSQYSGALIAKEDMLEAVNAGSNMQAIGELMYSKYTYPVIIGAFLLLVAMIAAVGLTLRSRTDVKRNNPVDQVRVKSSDRLRMVKMDAVKESTNTDTEVTQ